MLCATIPRDRIVANAKQDLLEMDGFAKVKQSLVSESNVNQLDTDKCKNMWFLIGIIEQSGGQLWIFKINILFYN